MKTHTNHGKLSRGTFVIIGAVSAATTVIVDDLGSGFSRYGPVSNWHEVALAMGVISIGLGMVLQQPRIMRDGSPILPVRGHISLPYLYQIIMASTTAATYKVFHNGITDTRVVNQNNFSNAWVNLGVFYFSAAGGEYVELADKTGETYETEWIGFDAVSFTQAPSFRQGVDYSYEHPSQAD